MSIPPSAWAEAAPLPAGSDASMVSTVRRVNIGRLTGVGAPRCEGPLPWLLVRLPSDSKVGEEEEDKVGTVEDPTGCMPALFESATLATFRLGPGFTLLLRGVTMYQAAGGEPPRAPRTLLVMVGTVARAYDGGGRAVADRRDGEGGLG
jgi:hypothetical protein